MLLVEERLFPGDELAAAMAAAVVAAAGDSGGGAAGLEASGPGTAEVGEGGSVARKEGNDAARKSLLLKGLGLSDMEGGWGEDGTTAGSLTHLVECMLEVRNGGDWLPGQRYP